MVCKLKCEPLKLLGPRKLVFVFGKCIMLSEDWAQNTIWMACFPPSPRPLAAILLSVGIQINNWSDLLCYVNKSLSLVSLQSHRGKKKKVFTILTYWYRIRLPLWIQIFLLSWGLVVFLGGATLKCHLINNVLLWIVSVYQLWWSTTNRPQVLVLVTK